jgi:hypothetical protein
MRHQARPVIAVPKTRPRNGTVATNAAGMRVESCSCGRRLEWRAICVETFGVWTDFHSSC